MGNLARATRHIEAGLKILDKAPNAWLLGVLWLVKSAVEAVGGSPTQALKSARRARDAARISGHERMRCSALSNIALMSLWSADLEQADAAFREILQRAPKGSTLWFAIIESYALRHLYAGDLEQCDWYLRAGETELRLQQRQSNTLQFLELQKARARFQDAKGDVRGALGRLTEALPQVRQLGRPGCPSGVGIVESAAIRCASGELRGPREHWMNSSV